MKQGNILAITLGIVAVAGVGFAIYHFGFKDKKPSSESTTETKTQATETKQVENKVAETKANEEKLPPSNLLNKNIKSPIQNISKTKSFKF